MKKAEYLMRLATPDVKYGAAAEADIARIVASTTTVGTQPPAQRPTRRRMLIPVVAVLAMVALVVEVASFRSTPAVAATPPMLAATPLKASAADLLTALAQLRREHPSLTSTIELQSWSLNTEIDGKGQIVVSNVQPTRTSTTFNSDGSADVTTAASEPFPGQERAGLQPVGTVLGTEHAPPGETFPDMLPSPVPVLASDVGLWAGALFGDESVTSGQAVRNLVGILLSYPATAEQESAVLDYFARLDDVQVFGEVKDRLGRPGLAFTAADGGVGEYQEVLIVSPETGSIIASETVYLGADRTDITAPSVIYYATITRT